MPQAVTPRSSYAGAFDPDLRLSDFSRQALAHLGREYLLNGHLQDRAGLPGIFLNFGAAAQVAVSIEEWMSASPIYSERMQRALNFVGHDVSTVFKNLQLDIGAPHQFMDFRFQLDDPKHGEFWLAHCGALMDVEPFGPERVKQMCHDIEDPTFDATAAATHPCMKMRPIHRPPRVPSDRMPHCRWQVFIDEEGKAYEQHANLAIVRRSKLAAMPFEAPADDAEPGGWRDYSGAFDPDFQLEDLSHHALVVVNSEFALQSHLLARGFLISVAQRFGEDEARRTASAQWTGIAALTARRLLETMEIRGDGIDAIAKLFQIHPAFFPRSYVDFRVAITGPGTAHIALHDCPALAEGDPYSWFAQLGEAPHPALDAIAAAVNPRARCRPARKPGAAQLAWDVVIDPAAEPMPEPRELKLAQLSKGARFRFQQRRPLRV
jgi:hypothetical protein